MMAPMRSLMKSEKTTPLRIGAKLERSFPIETHWDWSLRYDFIKKVAVESNLKMMESFLQRRSLITLSKEFEESRSSRTVAKRRSVTSRNAVENLIEGDSGYCNVTI
jgi:hypothetical protein